MKPLEGTKGQTTDAQTLETLKAQLAEARRALADVVVANKALKKLKAEKGSINSSKINELQTRKQVVVGAYKVCVMKLMEAETLRHK